ncbi:hypothetical protein KAI04_04835 [Candidatus Pacearchaeota archaeon]|nr:hypothetical protein [Candidatus Pacearchaeota archaeon]
MPEVIIDGFNKTATPLGINSEGNINVVLDGVRVRESGLVIVPKEEDRMITGNVYQTGSYFKNMADGASGLIFLCTGSSDIHFTLESRTDGNGIFEFYENVQVTDSGVILPIFNRSRHAEVIGSIIDAAIWINPIVSSSGGMIHSAMFLGGSGPGEKFASAAVSIAPENADWLLEAGSCYMVKIKNEAYRTMNVDFNIVMHKHGH